ncbi:MAG: hypothetical protein EOS61_14225 [Mesorhizobium sp.]|nr:MAG: hypothetical protein EOS61_14225 [Mesorhizobium sp.]
MPNASGSASPWRYPNKRLRGPLLRARRDLQRGRRQCLVSGNAIRASLVHYNTVEEVRRFGEALRAIIAKLSGSRSGLRARQNSHSDMRFGRAGTGPEADGPLVVEGRPTWALDLRSDVLTRMDVRCGCEILW